MVGFDWVLNTSVVVICEVLVEEDMTALLVCSPSPPCGQVVRALVVSESVAEVVPTASLWEWIGPGPESEKVGIFVAFFGAIEVTCEPVSWEMANEVTFGPTPVSCELAKGAKVSAIFE